MIIKGGNLQTRAFNFQKHDMALGRSFMGELYYAYNTGKDIAHTIDQGYRVLKHIHGRVSPALEDQAPGVAKAATKSNKFI